MGSKRKRKHDSSDSDEEKEEREVRKKRRKRSHKEDEKRKKRNKKKSKKKKRRRSSSTDSSSSSSTSSSSTSSSSSCDRRRRKRKSKKKMKLQKEKEIPVVQGPEVPLSIRQAPKERPKMAPMTKEEWEKRRSEIKRVYDEETGRHRLIRGDGEILEEIVSKERHKEINKLATVGDGLYFQSKLPHSK